MSNYDDALRDLVPSLQFKKHEKYPWRRLKSARLLKVTVVHGCFSRFLNCTNGTKSHKTSHIRWLYLTYFSLKFPFVSIFSSASFSKAYK